MQIKTPLRTQLEKVYLQISFQIKRKLNWQTKVFDVEIMEKYRKEFNQEAFGYEEDPDFIDLSEGEEERDDFEPDEWERDTSVAKPIPFQLEKQKFREIVDLAIEDAQTLATLMKEKNQDWTLVNPHITLADSILPQELREALLAEVERLENTKPDYHPNTDDMVLDIVHPSLFCAIAGKTVYRRFDGKLEVCSKPRSNYSQIYDKFQWLPAEFEILSSGMVQQLQPQPLN